MVPDYRVTPVNEEQPTKLEVAGFITEWKSSGENSLKPLTLEVQSLEHHKTQYLDLHHELQKMDHHDSPQSQAALQNLNTLLLLEIQLLLGCDVEWSVPTPPDSAVADTSVLSTAGEGADADDSS